MSLESVPDRHQPNGEPSVDPDSASRLNDYAKSLALTTQAFDFVRGGLKDPDGKEAEMLDALSSAVVNLLVATVSVSTMSAGLIKAVNHHTTEGTV